VTAEVAATKVHKTEQADRRDARSKAKLAGTWRPGIRCGSFPDKISPNENIRNPIEATIDAMASATTPEGNKGMLPLAIPAQEAKR
jgi:hypothetical protein